MTSRPFTPGAAPARLTLRALEPADQAFLWDMLHHALWDPPPAAMRPRAVLDDPRVRIYAEGWGRAGDVGVAALHPDADGAIGACWMRVVPGGQGLAHVDDTTPQLGIALLPPWRAQGHGGTLLRAALAAARRAGHGQVALTVHPANPAIALYAACGFVHQGLRNTYHLMVAPL